MSTVFFCSIAALGDSAGMLCTGKLDASIDPKSASCVALSAEELAKQTVRGDFAWFSSDGKVITAGYVESAARTIGAIEFVDVLLSLRGSDAELWPVPVTLRLTAQDNAHVTTIAIPPSAVPRLQRLRVPRNQYDLVLNAVHHRPLLTRVSAQGPKPYYAGTLTLLRLPFIRGEVRDKETGMPLQGALVILPSERTFAMTDAAGFYRGEITDAWPSFLRIDYPGRGSVTVAVPKVEADTQLLTAALSRGGSVVAAVTHSDPITVELAALASDDVRVVAHRELASDVAIVRFDGFAPGRYRMLFRGDGPLQQLSEGVEIQAARTTEVTIDLDDVPLNISVRRGQNPVPDAHLELIAPNSDWTANVALNAEGEGTFSLWQQGEYGVYVTAPGIPTVFPSHRILTGSESIDWRIDVLAGRVHGRVVDRKSGAPVGDVLLYLDVTTSEGASLVWTKSGADGLYEFSFVTAGQLAVSAHSDKYADYKYSFQLFESEPDRVLNIELEPALSRRIAVVTPSGLPIPGATVVDEAGNARAPWVTGADGTVLIPLRQNESKILYVFPKEGSLAVARITPIASDSNDAFKIVVPQGEADLSIRAESDKGEPIANAAFIIRVNGELLPASVITIAEQVQGQRLRTDGTGTAMLYRMPAGLIELWPYFSAEDARSIKQGTGPGPKAQINVRPGLNQIKLTFAQYSP